MRTDRNDEMENKHEIEQPLRHPLAIVVRDQDKLKINKQLYKILIDKDNAIDVDLLRKKYDPYLDQYDFLVGDISSEHLRLKGFYKDYVKTAIDRKESTIADYLIEYCNPGSAYFVLELVSPVHHHSSHRKPDYRTRRRMRRQAQLNGGFKKRHVHKTKFPKHRTITTKQHKGRAHSFVIKKKG